MHLEIQTLHPQLIQKALDFFNDDDILLLKKKSTFKESLVARYLIHNFQGYTSSSFSSISHKHNLVFIGIHNKKIGIDIEIIKKRDTSLLHSFNFDEYKLLGGKNWENFYFLWTAKESIIKLGNMSLDIISDITLIHFVSLKNNYTHLKRISNIEFSKKMIYTYKNTEYRVYSHTDTDANFVYSLALNM